MAIGLFDMSGPITVAEAARELGKSEAWVKRLVADGRIKATRHGARVLLIDPRSLDAVRNLAMGRPKKGTRSV
jgi:excisionase family DNA binding protein